MQRNRAVFILCTLASILVSMGVDLTLTHAAALDLNVRSAILLDAEDGKTLFEKNADQLIAPASITKVLSLYVLFDAIHQGEIKLWDNVQVSARAACTGGSRMGLRKGDVVPLSEVIKGMAVVSGNDACVAAAEHLSGDVDVFVARMNRKARELGMTNTVFKTPNGLPAKGQLTTARDIGRLSYLYLRKYPESLAIHSMQSYTYRSATHRNANRLLATCPGVDGLKTGFVCASGFNLSATARRGDTRIIAVVMGAPSPGIRARETERLLEYGFDILNGHSLPIIEARDEQRRDALGGQSLEQVKPASSRPVAVSGDEENDAPACAPAALVKTAVKSKGVAVKSSRSVKGKATVASRSSLSASRPKGSSAVASAKSSGKSGGQKATVVKSAAKGQSQDIAKVKESANKLAVTKNAPEKTKPQSNHVTAAVDKKSNKQPKTASIAQEAEDTCNAAAKKLSSSSSKKVGVPQPQPQKPRPETLTAKGKKDGKG